ncbi:hypothetical protein LPJ63_002704 [Coemansia sp. RSA 2711]|nr:hypothetical protein LPJ63_002704 [Coemansia sp. RSA 2711]KAJ1841046.1 hypothetical protein LPJ70_004382 [Coemansia sp. RSA 2708]KAJ2309206.1 hypothetical protein IWW54_003853 [Coemansia sp. RSA 2705]KAJ2311532.1 hypothetical protein IWW52_005106 [Coemansia sp. RSA 2704]KAJ2385538.1 hypothetical protein H4S02_004276 [Coemansia sp. RSA 2611]KAJ2712906.1 hypothetical protein H4R23_006061 [Coemansia sp. Cherry 401B]
MPDPQDCVCAGTCANPPTALEQDSHYEPQPLLEHRPTLNTHYTVVTERFVEPKKHPNAGIGGYQDVQHHSDIGGYYDISRESEIGNDHVDSGGYPIRRFLHKLCHPKEFHKH